MKFKKVKKATIASNKIEKVFTKYYSDEELVLCRNKSITELKDVVAQTNAHVLKAKSEMEANAEYQKAKEVIDTFRASFSEVKQYADAKKMLCLYLLQTKGEVDIGQADEVVDI